MSRISIIVNTFNGEKTINETIQSVLSQRFQDYELILFDDCSTDATVKLIKQISDSRIKFHCSKQNQGLGASRAAALKEAKGEWVAFLDQDDLWSTTHLEAVVAKSEEHEDYSFIYSRAVRFFDNGHKVDYDHRHEYKKLPEGDIFLNLFEESCFLAMGSVVFKRAELNNIDEVPSNITACPDYYFYLKLAHNKRVGAVQEVGCYYRMYQGNMTDRYGVIMQTEILWLLDQWKSFLPDSLYRKRSKIHYSNLAYCLWRQNHKGRAALRTLLNKGSLWYLLARPFAQAVRKLKRKFVLPFWQRKRNLDVEFIGTKVSAFDFEFAVKAIRSMVEKNNGGYVSCANAFGLTMAHEESNYQTILNNADIVTTDGMPVVWALNAMGNYCERVHNDDLVLTCCERYPKWRQVLVGGREGQPEEVALELTRKFPEIDIQACFPTPKRPVPQDYTDKLVKQINELKPDVVWVALGTPAQDHWMAEVNGRIKAPMVACGSLFDLLSGRTKPAPEWIKKAGLQWLFRLSLEPKRLFKRYAYYNSKFVYLALKSILKHKKSSKGIKHCE
jgi:N-acetylglucosaminyldiphosphoundecaprenol N-acetyl-beta-D-mannosaminyltransferase